MASQSPPVPLLMAQTLSESSLVLVPPAIGVLSAPPCVIADIHQEIDIGACFYPLQLRYLLIVLSSIIAVLYHVWHNALSPTFIRRLILVHALTFAIGIPVNCVSSAPPCIVTNVHQKIDIGISAPPTIADVQDNVLNSIYVFLTPSFTSHADVEYVEIYENEQLYAKVANAMADQSKSALLGVNPPFFYVTCGHYIGVFSGRHFVETMVEDIEHALYTQVNSLEDGERAVRRAIEIGEIVKFLMSLEKTKFELVLLSIPAYIEAAQGGGLLHYSSIRMTRGRGCTSGRQQYTSRIYLLKIMLNMRCLDESHSKKKERGRDILCHGKAKDAELEASRFSRDTSMQID
ncbi:hypothetical protein F4604DRAFT_1677285 [Suillus subluteus]|nr:hypothetical protein F4604DRAFT_1677285 [Suillus subluteus]